MPTVEIRKPEHAEPPYYANAASARANARLMSLGGFAADGITRVDLLSGGNVAKSVAVDHNIFSFDPAVVATIPVSELAIVARDAKGEVIFESEL